MRPTVRRRLTVAALFVVTCGISTPLAAYGVFLPVLAEAFGWSRGAISTALSINLLPDHDMRELFTQQRGGRMLLSNFLAQYLPRRFADVWCGQFTENKPLNQYSEKALAAFADRLHGWQITPTGTLGYAKAEVTCGGVDTHALSSKSMQANDVPGLYFIGEVVDVTGQLGGFNFQWAWASGHAAGQYC